MSKFSVFMRAGEEKEVGEDLKPLALVLTTVQMVQQATHNPHHEDKKKEDDDTWTTRFVAVEHFTMVTEDLFRTVMVGQLEPATFAHPNHAALPWTRVSPHLLHRASSKREKSSMVGCQKQW